KEDGSGAGGYAKEMSNEWFEAAERMLAAEMKGIDVVIGTALIPGKPAPRLITEPMVQSMKVGSVTVDLAAATGGNIATTRADEVYKTPNGVTCIGYTDMTSRLANTASTLFSNNVVKLFSSAGPFSTGDKGKFQIDYNDEAVRGVLAVDAGTVTWPAPQKPPPPPPAKKDEVEEVEAVPIDIEAMYKKSAMRTTATSATVLGLGMISPNLAFSNMMTTFALSGIVGYQASWVSHSLHSPLMAVTNAISGLTALGGMYLMGPGLVPHTTAELLGAGAVLISTVNISGGFLVTKKMLDMFKRPDDPPEYYQMYLLPAGTLLGGYAVTKAAGYPQMDHFMSMASAVCCIGGIGGLSSQSTARLGNVLGMSGVAFGVAATVGTLAPGPAQLAQLAGLMGVGGVGGYQVAKRVGPSELPQTVAAFHSLVGLAACGTAVGDYTHHMHDPAATADAVRMSAVYLASFIGGATATGSVVAFGKLQGLLPSAALKLPGRDPMNAGVGLACLGGMAAFVVGPSSPAMGCALLGLSAAGSGFLGAHMTASIGGADMPVV
ncbi:unnamed protein product, partial [Ectocarpus sp. 12 AP-2014]